MREILLLLAITTSLIAGCQNSNKDLKTYQYPKDSLYSAKVFTFCNLDNLETKMNVVHHVYMENDTTFYLKYSLEETGRDSSIFKKLNNEFVLNERYMVFPKGPDKINTTSKGKILEWIDNYLNNKSIIEFEDVNDPDVTIRIEGQSKLDSTMVYDLRGKKINSVRYIEKTNISITHKKYNSAKSSFEIEGESIWGKNLGMIYFKTRNKRTGKIDSWELESIINYEEFIKSTGANTLE